MWDVLAGVLLGGLLVLAGVFLAGMLVYKTRRDGAPLFVPSQGDVEVADIPGAEVFDEPEVDIFAEMDKQQHEQFMQSLANGKVH